MSGAPGMLTGGYGEDELLMVLRFLVPISTYHLILEPAKLPIALFGLD